MPENSDEWLKAYRDHEQRCVEAAKLPPGPERDAAYREVGEEFDKLAEDPRAPSKRAPDERRTIFNRLVAAWFANFGTIDEAEQRAWSSWFREVEPLPYPPESSNRELQQQAAEWRRFVDAEELDFSGLGLAPHVEQVVHPENVAELVRNVASSAPTAQSLRSRLDDLTSFLKHWTELVRAIEWTSPTEIHGYPKPSDSDPAMLNGRIILGPVWDKRVAKIRVVTKNQIAVWAELMRRDLLLPLSILALVFEIRIDQTTAEAECRSEQEDTLHLLAEIKDLVSPDRAKIERLVGIIQADRELCNLPTKHPERSKAYDNHRYAKKNDPLYEEALKIFEERKN